eukprot:3281732-Prymnesium_polylepis.2
MAAWLQASRARLRARPDLSPLRRKCSAACAASASPVRRHRPGSRDRPPAAQRPPATAHATHRGESA